MKEKNTMNNMIAKIDYKINEGPDNNSKAAVMKWAKEEHNKLYADIVKNPTIKGDKRKEKLGLLWAIYNGYKSNYRVKTELDLDKGPIDVELQRIENGQLKTHRLDMKYIHPNVKQKVSFKCRSKPRKGETVEEMNEKHKIYERKIAIVFRGKCIVREGWHRQTNKKELKVFDHDVSQETGYIK